MKKVTIAALLFGLLMSFTMQTKSKLENMADVGSFSVSCYIRQTKTGADSTYMVTFRDATYKYIRQTESIHFSESDELELFFNRCDSIVNNPSYGVSFKYPDYTLSYYKGLGVIVRVNTAFAYMSKGQVRKLIKQINEYK